MSVDGTAFLEAFLQQKSYNKDMLGFNLFLHHPPYTSKK